MIKHGVSKGWLVAVTLLVASSWAGPDEKMEWLTDYKKGVETAQAAKKPLLLDFWAEW